MLEVSKKISRVVKKPCNRVLLINIPQTPAEFNFDLAKKKRYFTYPPYGLGVLCSNLKLRGYSVRLLDLNFEILHHINGVRKDSISDTWRNKLERTIENFNPDVVGISCTFTMNHHYLKEVAEFIKKHNNNLVIIAGGVHPTLTAEFVLHDCKEIDFVSLFEGDSSFCDMLDFVNEKIDADELTQIATIVDNNYFDYGKLSHPKKEELSIIPDYLDLPIERYSSVGEIGAYRFWLPKDSIVTTSLSNRGCRGHCAFCSVRSFNGKGVRSREIKAVVNEIKKLKYKYGISHISWLDDDLFFNEMRGIKLFNEITKQDLKITWDASNGIVASAVTPELMRSAAESGCIGLHLGIETGNDKILQEIRKPSSLKDFKRAAKILKGYPKIFTKGFLMIGFPNETLRQMLDTVNLALELSLDWYTVQLVSPLPSTDMHEMMVKSNMIDSDKLDTNIVNFGTSQIGRQRLREQKEKTNANDFFHLFEANLDIVPNKDILNDVWFLVDYKINYERILIEDDLVPLQKWQKFLTDVCDRMTKENALANLFLAIIERKLGNLKEAKSRKILSQKYLDSSQYWKKRFEVLELEELY